jgi:hypothetical protein
MIKREELDVFINGEYPRLKENDKIMEEKCLVEIILELSKLLESIETDLRLHIIYNMPRELYYMMKTYGLETTVDNEKFLQIDKKK